MKKLYVLTYHYIISGRDPIQKNILGPGKQQFIDQVNFLADHYNIISPHELKTFFSVENTLPEVNVLLTFDDGLREHSESALPILNSNNIKGIFFVPTCVLTGELSAMHILHYSLAHYRFDRVVKWTNEALQSLGISPLFSAPQTGNIWGKITALKLFFRYVIDYNVLAQVSSYLVEQGLKRDFPDFFERIFLGREDIRALHDSGHAIGQHTHTHLSLGAHYAKSTIHEELQKSTRLLRDTTGASQDYFAFPYGSKDDIPQEIGPIDDLLGKYGMRFAFTTINGTNHSDDSIVNIKRTSIYARDSLADLEKIIS